MDLSNFLIRRPKSSYLKTGTNLSKKISKKKQIYKNLFKIEYFNLKFNIKEWELKICNKQVILSK